MARSSILTEDQLETAFRTYFDEIHRCDANKCYWALLHLLVIMPDICGAMESENGEANPTRYLDWCKRYLASEDLSKEEWYEMRCSLLHQGRTLPRKKEQPKGRYHRYSFSQPDSQMGSAHRQKSSSNGRIEINLDVSELMGETLAGMQVWFYNLCSGKEPIELVHRVEKNISTIANVAPRGEESVKGFIVRETLIINQSTASPR